MHTSVMTQMIVNGDLPTMSAVPRLIDTVDVAAIRTKVASSLEASWEKVERPKAIYRPEEAAERPKMRLSSTALSCLKATLSKRRRVLAGGPQAGAEEPQPKTARIATSEKEAQTGMREVVREQVGLTHLCWVVSSCQLRNLHIAASTSKLSVPRSMGRDVPQHYQY